NDQRNIEYDIQTVLSDLNHLAGDPENEALDFKFIVKEINGGRPVCCHITWGGGDPNRGHYNLIAGYDSDNQDVDICDCAFDDRTLPLTTFTTAYQGNG